MQTKGFTTIDIDAALLHQVEVVDWLENECLGDYAVPDDDTACGCVLGFECANEATRFKLTFC